MNRYAMVTGIALGLGIAGGHASKLGAQECEINFDTSGALKAGYSRNEIAGYLRSACDTAPRVTYDDLIPDDSFQAALDRRRRKARQDSLEEYSEFLAIVQEDERQNKTRLMRERIDRWLWTLPLAALVLVIVVAIRGEAFKAWIGRLHVGQMIILVGGLLVGGTLFGPAALFFVKAWGSEGDWSWLLGFIPIGPISAVQVLWYWFGARAKAKKT